MMPELRFSDDYFEDVDVRHQHLRAWLVAPVSGPVAAEDASVAGGIGPAVLLPECATYCADACPRRSLPVSVSSGPAQPSGIVSSAPGNGFIMCENQPYLMHQFAKLEAAEVGYGEATLAAPLHVHKGDDPVLSPGAVRASGGS